MDLLYFILSCYGLTQILTSSKILQPIRPKHYFFSCPMCMGFWVGVLVWFISPCTQLFMFNRSIITALLLGSLSSGTSYVLCTLFGDEGINYVRKHNN